MRRYVLDASVAVKWLPPEDLSPQAVRLLKGNNSFLAPDLIYGEVGNVLWKRARRGDISNQFALAAYDLFIRFDVTTVACAKMTPLALNAAFGPWSEPM